MIPYRDLWEELCSYDNLFLAYKKARKHKTAKQYVIDFEKHFPNEISTKEINRTGKTINFKY